MQPIKHAVILAAGLGSRLGLDLPKCLVEVHGKKLIEYQLNLLSEIPNVYIVVGFKEKKSWRWQKKVRPDVIFVRNPTTKIQQILQYQSCN
ncbi:MAG: NTP transferase domain-containing protein [Holosporaceae bacterium]|nr:MAG: NTP transferase domain-containing protein [Holosporaceae bacterium]